MVLGKRVAKVFRCRGVVFGFGILQSRTKVIPRYKIFEKPVDNYFNNLSSALLLRYPDNKISKNANHCNFVKNYFNKII